MMHKITTKKIIIGYLKYLLLINLLAIKYALHQNLYLLSIIVVNCLKVTSRKNPLIPFKL